MRIKYIVEFEKCSIRFLYQKMVKEAEGYIFISYLNKNSSVELTEKDRKRSDSVAVNLYILRRMKKTLFIISDS